MDNKKVATVIKRKRAKADDRKFWAAVVKKNRKRINKELLALTGKEFLDTLLKINSFVIPTLRAVDMTGDVNALTDAQVKECWQNIISKSNGK